METAGRQADDSHVWFWSKWNLVVSDDGNIINFTLVTSIHLVFEGIVNESIIYKPYR